MKDAWRVGECVGRMLQEGVEAERCCWCFLDDEKDVGLNGLTPFAWLHIGLE